MSYRLSMKTGQRVLQWALDHGAAVQITVDEAINKMLDYVEGSQKMFGRPLPGALSEIEKFFKAANESRTAVETAVEFELDPTPKVLKVTNTLVIKPPVSFMENPNESAPLADTGHDSDPDPQR